MGEFLEMAKGKGGKGGKKAKNAVADAVMDEVSDTIHDQKKILKEEMVQVIDKKIDDKIKAQLQEIHDLQAKINKLKQGNNEFAETADAKLSELNSSVSQMNMVRDIAGIREGISAQQKELENELAENQKKIDAQLEEIHEKMTEAIELAKKEAIENNKCCCTIL